MVWKNLTIPRAVDIWWAVAPGCALQRIEAFRGRIVILSQRGTTKSRRERHPAPRGNSRHRYRRTLSCDNPEWLRLSTQCRIFHIVCLHLRKAICIKKRRKQDEYAHIQEQHHGAAAQALLRLRRDDELACK
nr:hypothetical protein [Chromobacterium amazonense]